MSEGEESRKTQEEVAESIKDLAQEVPAMREMMGHMAEYRERREKQYLILMRAKLWGYAPGAEGGGGLTKFCEAEYLKEKRVTYEEFLAVSMPMEEGHLEYEHPLHASEGRDDFDRWMVESGREDWVTSRNAALGWEDQ